ncbi:hypothetical protein GOV12_01625 [Candidatus Pacearchaeota archaeon]|nr:hypothetical protein [Candidatus Pacearchaeota archaeon]
MLKDMFAPELSGLPDLDSYVKTDLDYVNDLEGALDELNLMYSEQSDYRKNLNETSRSELVDICSPLGLDVEYVKGEDLPDDIRMNITGGEFLPENVLGMKVTSRKNLDKSVIRELEDVVRELNRIHHDKIRESDDNFQVVTRRTEDFTNAIGDLTEYFPLTNARTVKDLGDLHLYIVRDDGVYEVHLNGLNGPEMTHNGPFKNEHLKPEDLGDDEWIGRFRSKAGAKLGGCAYVVRNPSIKLSVDQLIYLGIDNYFGFAKTVIESRDDELSEMSSDEIITESLRGAGLGS